MKFKNIYVFSLLLVTSQHSFSSFFGKAGMDNVAASINNAAGAGKDIAGSARDIAGSVKDVAGSVNNVAGAGKDIAGSVTGMTDALNSTADSIGKGVTGLVGLGALWAAGSKVKSWVWPSRSDKVGSMATDEAYLELSAKQSLKNCMKANINTARDKFGFPCACRDQACEYAFEAGDEKAEAMGRTFNKFYPQKG